MAQQARTKIKEYRRQALNEYLSARGHDQQVVEFLHKMEELLEAEEFGREEKDRFAAYSTLVDKHWRIVERFLPKEIKDEPVEQVKEESVSRGSLIAERLLGRRLEEDNSGTVQKGSVVPTPIRPEKG